MARLFDDSAAPDEYLNAGSAVVTGAPFSCSIWAKSDDGTDDFQVMANPENVGSDNGWKWRLRMSSNRHHFEAEQTAPPRSGRTETPVPAANTWGLLSADEIATNSRRGFLNGGNLDTNSTIVSPSGIDDVSVARRDDGTPADRFSGDLGHYALWDKSGGLPDQAHEALAAGHSPLRIFRDDLVSYWPINGRSPERNVISGGPDLTVNGTPSVSEEPPMNHPIVAP